MKAKLVLLLISFWTAASYAGSVPQSFNFDGVLLDSNSVPITTLQTVKFGIYSPGGGCLLYEETQPVTPDAQGNFSVQVGTGTVTGFNPGISWYTIFQNSFAIRAPSSPQCSPGYTPASDDQRVLRVTVGSSVLTPDFQIASVPMAVVAESLQGKLPTDFVSTNSASSIVGTLAMANTSPIKFMDSSAGYVGFKAPSTVSPSVIWTLPNGDGTANSVLTTNGAGQLSWTTPSGGGGQTGPASLTFNSNSDGTGSDGGFNFQSNGTNLLSIDNVGNTTISGAVTVSGPTALGTTVIAANNNLSMAGGNGKFSQIFAGSGPAASITMTASASGDILDLVSTSTVAVTNDKALNVLVTGLNGTSSVTRYGVYSSVSSSGTGANNVAGYFSSSNGASNSALLVGLGNVGIGSLTPAYRLDVVGDINISAANVIRVGGSPALSMPNISSVAVGAGFGSAGSLNTGVGVNSGGAMTGSSNTLLGNSAGNSLATGSSNIIIGSGAGNVTTGSNNIIIGTLSTVPSGTASNQLNIGNTIYGNLSVGNVGIGTTSPTSQLDVRTPSGSAQALSVGPSGSAPIYQITKFTATGMTCANSSILSAGTTTTCTGTTFSPAYTKPSGALYVAVICGLPNQAAVVACSFDNVGNLFASITAQSSFTVGTPNLQVLAIAF